MTELTLPMFTSFNSTEERETALPRVKQQAAPISQPLPAAKPVVELIVPDVKNYQPSTYTYAPATKVLVAALHEKALPNVPLEPLSPLDHLRVRKSQGFFVEEPLKDEPLQQVIQPLPAADFKESKNRKKIEKLLADKLSSVPFARAKEAPRRSFSKTVVSISYGLAAAAFGPPSAESGAMMIASQGIVPESVALKSEQGWFKMKDNALLKATNTERSNNGEEKLPKGNKPISIRGMTRGMRSEQHQRGLKRPPVFVPDQPPEAGEFQSYTGQQWTQYTPGSFAQKLNKEEDSTSKKGRG